MLYKYIFFWAEVVFQGEGETVHLIEKDEEEPNEAKKLANKNWDLIKAFGCCNCSTAHALSKNWHKVILLGELN
nr:hypothetical protein CFP56_32720 [Quercus suber]